MVWQLGVPVAGNLLATAGHLLDKDVDTSLTFAARFSHSRKVPHHAPEFEMNEAGLPVGLRVALGVLRSRLGG
jgi:hypothetical protein